MGGYRMCPGCGRRMHLIDGVWRCGHCGHVIT